jgi:uncharacterized protein (TIGR04141 family)
MTAIKPTIYLIKAGIKDPRKIFRKDKKVLSTEKDGVFVFYTNSKKYTPEWANYLSENFDITTTPFNNSSSQAVIVLEIDERLMAIPLGMGIYLLDMTKTDYNFGLKTALNCIPKAEIRQIDTTTPEINSQKTKKLAPKGSTPEEFGINKQKDILRGITGKLPASHSLGKSMDGKDGLRLIKDVQGLLKLKSLCKNVYEHFKSDNYRKDYPWIDNIALVRDNSLIDQLTKQLVKSLKNAKFENMFFSPPVYYDEIFDYQGFVFSSGDGSRLSGKDSFEMPDMLDWGKSMGDARKQITHENLDIYKVNLVNEDNGREQSWPIQRCLSWETDYNKDRYVLSEGSWYAVATDFFKLVNDFYINRIRDSKDLPVPSKSKIKESDYNAELSNSSKYRYLFDLGHAASRNKSIGEDDNEVCDVYDTSTKTFFHIKMGKTSPAISHLFRQGAYSGQILKQDEQVREEFIQHLIDYGCTNNVISTPYTPSEYQIVFGLVIGKRQKKDVPFFSKVSFRDIAENNLELMGYGCGIVYITCP